MILWMRPLRRGKQTVHTKFGTSTALLAGDVVMVIAYDYLNKISNKHLTRVLALFNKTAREVCEGQQMDMDFESKENVSLEEYLLMIELKTSVLLAASLQMGAILGGAGEGNRNHLYEFGKTLVLLSRFRMITLMLLETPRNLVKMLVETSGKIKNLLLLRALEVASETQKMELRELMRLNPADKVEQVLRIFKDCHVHEWAKSLKQTYVNIALQHMEDIAVVSSRKSHCSNLQIFNATSTLKRIRFKYMNKQEIIEN